VEHSDEIGGSHHTVAGQVGGAGVGLELVGADIDARGLVNPGVRLERIIDEAPGSLRDRRRGSWGW